MYKDVGRKFKAKAENVNDHCRLSKPALKLKYRATEKMSYISTENLIKYPEAKPSPNCIYFI